jgi:hypothetical protein
LAVFIVVEAEETFSPNQAQVIAQRQAMHNKMPNKEVTRLCTNTFSERLLSLSFISNNPPFKKFIAEIERHKAHGRSKPLPYIMPFDHRPTPKGWVALIN